MAIPPFVVSWLADLGTIASGSPASASRRDPRCRHRRRRLLRRRDAGGAIAGAVLADPGVFALFAKLAGFALLGPVAAIVLLRAEFVGEPATGA